MQLSRDSRFVAIHDDTVNRTTNGQGKVHDLSLADLRRLDAGSWFGSEFTGERIPTLEEILEFASKHDVVFYLELKPSGSWGGEHALVGALRSSGEIARTIVISFDAGILEATAQNRADVDDRSSFRRADRTSLAACCGSGSAAVGGARRFGHPRVAGGSAEARLAGRLLDCESARAHAAC